MEQDFEASQNLISDWQPYAGPATPVDLLITGIGELVTMAGATEQPRRGDALSTVAALSGVAVTIGDGTILDIGPEADVIARAIIGEQTRVIDAGGRAVIPGLVDCHTHLPFAGSREDEFYLRLQGATYQEILAAGGGILETVRATRAASAADLTRLALTRMDAMLLTGTTTAEAKSGYGLATEHELKQLVAIAAAAASHLMELVPTFLGAHTVPAEFRHEREAYVDLLLREMLPQVANANRAAEAAGQPPLAAFCDVFVEDGAFTPAEARCLLREAAALGLRPKLHADQLSNGGGAALAAELGAVSADHLEHASPDGLVAMAAMGTVAVLLPGAAWCLRRPQANARRIIDLGVPVALATDFNPGSSPISSLPLIMSLACLELHMNPAEALAAATINAAHAIGAAQRIGSLERGKQADLVILDAPNYRHIAYRPGAALVHTVIKRGRVVVEQGRLIIPGAPERGE